MTILVFHLAYLSVIWWLVGILVLSSKVQCLKLRSWVWFVMNQCLGKILLLVRSYSWVTLFHSNYFTTPKSDIRRQYLKKIFRILNRAKALNLMTCLHKYIMLLLCCTLHFHSKWSSEWHLKNIQFNSKQKNVNLPTFHRTHNQVLNIVKAML